MKCKNCRFREYDKTYNRAVCVNPHLHDEGTGDDEVEKEDCLMYSLMIVGNIYKEF